MLPGIEEINLNGITVRCQQESELFFRRQSFDPRFCFELFRRAFMLRDEEAFGCVFRQYRRLVYSWIERHPLAASLDEEPDYFLNRAFEKMWAVITPQKFAAFPDLKSVLRYLQLCVHSVMIDHARGREKAGLLEDRLEDQEAEAERVLGEGEERGVEDDILGRLQGREVWGWVAARIKTEQERVLVLAMFAQALKPREVLEEYPRAFRTVDEVYTVKENLLDRLRRDPEFLQALSSLEGEVSGKARPKTGKNSRSDDAGKLGSIRV